MDARHWPVRQHRGFRQRVSILVQARRQLRAEGRALAELAARHDDHLLADIGLTRAELGIAPLPHVPPRSMMERCRRR